MSPLFLALTTALLALLPSLTHSISYTGPAPVIAHFPFDTDYLSQFNGYVSSSPASLLVPAVASSACPFGGSCVQLDGQQHLDVSPWLPLLGTVDGAALKSWSVGVWLNNGVGGWQAVLGSWGGDYKYWSLRLASGAPYLIWQFRDAQGNQQRVDLGSSHTLPQNTWTHLVVTFNATSQNVQFWVNGVITDSFATSAAQSYLGAGEPTTAWKVGLIEDAGIGYTGGIDELWAFSDVLSGDAILLLRAINSIGSCSPGTAGVAQYRIGTCYTCQPGTFAADIGDLVCSVCPAGTAIATPGAIACQACPAGTYSPTTNNTQCLVCPAGYYSPTPGSTACFPCAAGSFSAAGASTCSLCPANTLSAPASTSSASCSACPSGSSGGANIPVCCANGVSAAGQLLAALGSGLTGFTQTNACLLQTDVQQAGSVVQFLEDFCGTGYDSVFTSSLQSVYSEFSAFQSQANTAALQRVYCN